MQSNPSQVDILPNVRIRLLFTEAIPVAQIGPDFLWSITRTTTRVWTPPSKCALTKASGAGL